MKTLKRYQREEAAAYPHLNREHTDEVGRRKFLAAFYAEAIAKLCRLSTDPDAARQLYERHCHGQPSRWAEVSKFKALLLAAGLIDRKKLASVATDPPRGGDYETQALYLKE